MKPIYKIALALTVFCGIAALVAPKPKPAPTTPALNREVPAKFTAADANAACHQTLSDNYPGYDRRNDGKFPQLMKDKKTYLKRFRLVRDGATPIVALCTVTSWEDVRISAK